MGVDQDGHRPPEIGWDELVVRLSTRRAAEVDGDRIQLWTRPSHRVRMLLIFLAVCAFMLVMWSPGMRADAESDAVVPTIAGIGLAGWALGQAVRRGPVVTLDERGVTRGGLHVRWSDVQLIEFRCDRRHTASLLVVDPRGPSVATQPWWRRRLLLHGAFRQSVWGVRVPLGDTRTLPLNAEEVRALSAHPAFREKPGQVPRPSWAEETGKFMGQAGVVVEGDRLIVSDRHGERLRIDTDGVHGRLPVRHRSVPWEDLWELGLFTRGRTSALVLQLVPHARVEPVRERGWTGWARSAYQPSLPLPLRGLPVDAVGLTELLFAHPKGEALWRRTTSQ